MGLYPRSRCQMVSIYTLLIDASYTRISGLYLKENGGSYPNPWSRASITRALQRLKYKALFV